MTINLYRCHGVDTRDCYQCYSGEHCQNLSSLKDCQIQSRAGNPVVVSEYWTTTSSYIPCLSIPADYRYDNNTCTTLRQVENLPLSWPCKSKMVSTPCMHTLYKVHYKDKTMAPPDTYPASTIGSSYSKKTSPSIQKITSVQTVYKRVMLHF